MMPLAEGSAESVPCLRRMSGGVTPGGKTDGDV